MGHRADIHSANQSVEIFRHSHGSLRQLPARARACPLTLMFWRSPETSAGRVPLVRWGGATECRVNRTGTQRRYE